MFTQLFSHRRQTPRYPAGLEERIVRPQPRMRWY